MTRLVTVGIAIEDEIGGTRHFQVVWDDEFQGGWRLSIADGVPIAMGVATLDDAVHLAGLWMSARGETPGPSGSGA